ncbi:MAG: EAL domain-containing protein, partial [Methylotenera sp.]|nr:EAL domain-containing protein [Methylotenera sp.]
WLINNACQRCAELRSAHQYNIALTINLSSIDLLDADLPALLAQSIALWQIPAENLIIEITESDILVDELKVSQVIDKIKLLGCKLALDDFGTGYSSMARLRNMPIDIVKIDQSFVRNIATSNQDKEIVQSVVKLAHSLGKEVVAEGVENLACLTILKELKCEKIQGYYYAKPMPFDEFVLWLNTFETVRRV